MRKKLNCILLVDDDAPTNFLNKLFLEENEFAEHIEVAQGSAQALEYLRSANNCTPDLIFLDINMPAMDGWEFLKYYREYKKYQKRKIVIVMLTTSLNPDDESRSRVSKDITSFHYKPLTPEIVEEIIEKEFSMSIH
jgi:CheY-like chemotaxis protein